MLAASMKTYNDREGIEIAKSVERRIWSNLEPESSCTAHMRVRHGVYFRHHSPHLFVNNELIDTIKGFAIRTWLKGNSSGKYALQSSHVLFEDRDDALLCYLRFKG